MKQTKFMPKLGFIQVQITNSLFYVSIANTLMLSLTFWYTSGSIIAAKYAPWLTMWMFLSVSIVLLAIVMILDYKLMYPSRQGFISTQAYIHANPAVTDLKEIKKDLGKIKEKLGI